MPRLSSLVGGGIDTFAAMGGLKPSIILFDTNPGARTFTVPNGVTSIRAFVVGAGGDGVATGSDLGGGGGGYSEKVYTVSPGDVISYTVGAAPGGTSSFSGPGGGITATGGGDGAAGGSGSGGDTNTNGGTSTLQGGSASGHRFGNGGSATDLGGAGWGGDTGNSDGGSSGGYDGFGIGMIPAPRTVHQSNAIGQFVMGYGCGAPAMQIAFIGGGGGQNSNGGIGGGGGGYAASPGKGGFGLVGVEALA